MLSFLRFSLVCVLSLVMPAQVLAAAGDCIFDESLTDKCQIAYTYCDKKGTSKDLCTTAASKVSDCSYIEDTQKCQWGGSAEATKATTCSGLGGEEACKANADCTWSIALCRSKNADPVGLDLNKACVSTATAADKCMTVAATKEALSSGAAEKGLPFLAAIAAMAVMWA